jgi:hypothetical protein
MHKYIHNIIFTHTYTHIHMHTHTHIYVWEREHDYISGSVWWDYGDVGKGKRMCEIEIAMLKHCICELRYDDTTYCKLMNFRGPGW